MIKFNLKEILQQKKMTITELHEKSGISQNTISLIVNGKSNGIQFSTLEKMIKVLDCTLEELIIVISNLYKVSVKLLEVKNGIFIFSLIAITEEDIQSEIIYGFEATKSKSKNKTYLTIGYFGKDKTDLNKMNDELFIDSIFDFSNKTLSYELLKVYGYLIANEIIEYLNDPDINPTSVIIFDWYGLVKLKNEGIVTIHLISKGNDNFPGINTDTTAKVDLNTLTSINKVIEFNEKDTIITMHLE